MWMPGAAALSKETPCSIPQEEKLKDLGVSGQENGGVTLIALPGWIRGRTQHRAGFARNAAQAGLCSSLTSAAPLSRWQEKERRTLLPCLLRELAGEECCPKQTCWQARWSAGHPGSQALLGVYVPRGKALSPKVRCLEQGNGTGGPLGCPLGPRGRCRCETQHRASTSRPGWMGL